MTMFSGKIVNGPLKGQFKIHYAPKFAFEIMDVNPMDMNERAHDKPTAHHTIWYVFLDKSRTWETEGA